MTIFDLRFNIPEILALFGVIQCLYISVYMAFRAGKLSRAGVPIVYFLVLAGAFATDFSQVYVSEGLPLFWQVQWLLWFAGPPLSVLLIIQVAQISKVPSLWNYWVLLLPPMAYGAAVIFAYHVTGCDNLRTCDSFPQILVISGVSAGGLSLLAIWLNRAMVENMSKDKTTQERYWLILALIIVNAVFLGVSLLSLTDNVSAAPYFVLMRDVLGLVFIYLVITSLFRIYPQAVHLVERRQKNIDLSHDDAGLKDRILGLLTHEKVYLESGYSRTDLARELGVSETVISRIINVHFAKNFPQLLNEYRVDDAKRLLMETDAPISVIAKEVGFNSLASFNRVFKEISGSAPSYLRRHKGE